MYIERWTDKKRDTVTEVEHFSSRGAMRAAGTLPGHSSSWQQHYRPGDINDVVEAAVNLQIISWHQEIIQVG